MKAETARRHSMTVAIYDLLYEHRGGWVEVRDLARVGGYCAWRTRVSDARKIAEADGYVIEWNNSVKASAYRLRVRPLGPSAETVRARSLF